MCGFLSMVGLIKLTRDLACTLMRDDLHYESPGSRQEVRDGKVGTDRIWRDAPAPIRETVVRLPNDREVT